MKRFVAFAWGLLFALGLGVSGMTRPGRVLAFLDVAGAWDPRLAFVMGGAVCVGLVGFACVLRRSKPVLDERFHLPPSTSSSIDRRLLAGSVLFGIGWGLAGYCPGPALVSLASGAYEPWVFTAAMVLSAMAFRQRAVQIENEPRFSRPPASSSAATSSAR